MPLSMVTPGNTVRIEKISGTDVVRQHLSEIGFVMGDEVTVVSNTAGNLIVQVKGSRIALNLQMANRIMAA